MVKIEDPLLETASEVCGFSKKYQWKRETWWWDDKVEEAIKKKQDCFKSVAEREKFSNIAPNDSGIFKLAKQMDKTNQDVVGEKCVRCW